MGAKSTATQYGSVAILIHWASALVVIVAWGIGITLDKFSPTPPALLVVHMVLGVLVLLLTLMRLVWFIVADRRPAPPEGDPRLQRIAAKVVHVLLYAVLLLLPISGIATAVTAGVLPAITSGGAVPSFEGNQILQVHTAEGIFFFLLFVGHVGAALYHQVIKRDRLLARMGVGA